MTKVFLHCSILLVCFQRNPDIKLYGLPWTFPGWIGGGVFNPFINRTATVRYIINWIQGAWQHHGLSIDYIGVSVVFLVRLRQIKFCCGVLILISIL